MYDLIILGSGPAGLSAAISARRNDLRYVVLERGVIGETVYHFPIGRQMFSTANELELEPGDLDPKWKPTREDLLSYYCRLAADRGLNIQTGVEATTIIPGTPSHTVATKSGRFETRAVLVATGGFGKRRRLGIPGESEARVSYRFSEAFPYALRDVLVVGGGNSAAEASLWLMEAGARVTVSVRRASVELSPAEREAGSIAIKPWVLGPLLEAIGQNKIHLVTSSRVVEIKESTAVLEVAGRPELLEVPCSQVFALIGGDPDTSLLAAAGALIEGDGRPAYDPITFETTVPRIYVAGHLTRERHIRNAIQIARQVVDRLAEATVRDAQPCLAGTSE